MLAESADMALAPTMDPDEEGEIADDCARSPRSEISSSFSSSSWSSATPSPPPPASTVRQVMHKNRTQRRRAAKKARKEAEAAGQVVPSGLVAGASADEVLFSEKSRLPEPDTQHPAPSMSRRERKPSPPRSKPEEPVSLPPIRLVALSQADRLRYGLDDTTPDGPYTVRDRNPAKRPRSLSPVRPVTPVLHYGNSSSAIMRLAGSAEAPTHGRRANLGVAVQGGGAPPSVASDPGKARLEGETHSEREDSSVSSSLRGDGSVPCQPPDRSFSTSSLSKPPAVLSSTTSPPAQLATASPSPTLPSAPTFPPSSTAPSSQPFPPAEVLEAESFLHLMDETMAACRRVVELLSYPDED
ncbi:hypothetical protein JCM10908_006606 [Rhodotorula pacifica]|uniref:uncharacterized protein n=1 Tax=Rhodotorula pacifica TaxID=1495444 RepID=UPI0031723C4B